MFKSCDKIKHGAEAKSFSGFLFSSVFCCRSFVLSPLCVSLNLTGSLALVLALSSVLSLDPLMDKLYGLPCSDIFSNGMRKHFSLTSTGQHKQVLGISSGRKCNFLQGHSHINFQKAQFKATSRPFSPIACQVKRGDFEGSINRDSIILDQQMLEQELQIAIAEENYAKAAKIRDSIRNLHEDSVASVIAANAQFYDSFRNGDITAMQTLWSRGDNVCCVHPGSLGISGYELVIDSWNHVWANYEFPLEIELRDVRVHVRGSMGYVTCVELVRTKGSSWGGHFVTNGFEKVDGRWLICIHHASPFDF
ncbi:uncharacterized protein LOC116189085 isoform X2 [Punica granatum]|uniref:Uncharacterized protein LOC116189085 isoform X2 n=2 Tax=Punica granatum TaxID=22663 RepID=A0A6P8BU95_PUNGR|nr:uncharacterized protein LOC116189085 isoform X2 [Punica granatum]